MDHFGSLGPSWTVLDHFGPYGPLWNNLDLADISATAVSAACQFLRIYIERLNSTLFSVSRHDRMVL